MFTNSRSDKHFLLFAGTEDDSARNILNLKDYHQYHDDAFDAAYKRLESEDWAEIWEYNTAEQNYRKLSTLSKDN